MIVDNIVGASGELLAIEIKRFSALDGWDLQRQFVDYAASTDRDFKRRYTLEILSYASVLKGDLRIPLSTDALIDNHLGKWENIRELFEAILLDNGIDPKTHADQPHYWAEAGATMAVSFMAEATKMMGPYMNLLIEQQQG